MDWIGRHGNGRARTRGRSERSCNALPSDDPLNPDPATPDTKSPARPLSPFDRVVLGQRERQQTRRRRGLIGLVLAAAIVGSAVLSVPSALAAPKPTVTEVQRQVDKLQNEAESASEDYNDARVKLASINVRQKAAQGRLTRQRSEVRLAKQQLGRLAAESYKQGPLTTLDLVLGDNPDAALAQAGYLPSLADRQAGAMNRLKQGEQKLVATQAEIKDQQLNAQKTQAALKKSRSTVNKKLAEATAEVNKLKASQRAALARAQQTEESAGVPSGGGSALCNGKAVEAPSGAARAAIKFACAHLGDSYVWAADGPHTWDCSGLTMKAYAAAGISIPHSSRMQATYGTRVSVGSIEPGDLIFFNSPISHVAIYLGSGLMVHAPHTGDVVRVASVYQTPSAAVRF
jgi:cell wall-associated NlpC family hydrolase